MKKIIVSVCCLALILAFSSEAWSATKKKRRGKRHHRAAVTRPAPVVAPTPEVAPAAPVKQEGWWDKFETGYKKGLFFKSKDEKFSMKFRIRIQPRYTFQTNKTTGKNADNTFQIRRFKLSWEGNAFTKNLDYKVQINLAALSPIQDMVEYVYVDYRFFDPLRVEFGQFKYPYNRQQITSSGRQEFVDRSLASEEFRFASVDRTTTTTCTFPGGAAVSGSGLTCTGGATATTTISDSQRRFQFDTGVMVHGDAFGKKLEYYGAITNGTGPTRLNLNKNFLYTGRLVYNPLGQYGYSESDVEGSEHPALTFGLSGGYNVQDVTSNKILQAGGEVGFKYRGFSLQGEYYYRHNDLKDVNGVAVSTKNHDQGYYAQLGYFVIPHHFEIAARASQVFLAGKNNDKSEFSGALNYYIFGHDLKLQADYSLLRNEVDPTKFAGAQNKNDHRFRLQLQAWF
ncbi:MAG: porin [bacterium]